MTETLLKAFCFAVAAALCVTFWSGTVCASGYRSIDIRLPDNAGSLTCRAAGAFIRIAEEHAGRSLSGRRDALVLSLEMDCSVGNRESYTIRKSGSDRIVITASDEAGLVYGLGKVLHTGHFFKGCFYLGECAGSFSPDKPLRGIYLATHFGNYYQSAPIEDVVEYIEELALWGYNNLLVWLDLHTFDGIKDPRADRMVCRLASLLNAGREMGMETGLTMLANEGYATTPDSLKAVNPGFTDFYGVEVCPSAKGGTELILRQVAEVLDAFVKYGAEMDRIQLWPYDQGGCGCKKCSPWGGNGYLKISEEISDVVRRKLPEVKITLSTWLFDFKGNDKGEWLGLDEAFRHGKPWADAIMADSHTVFPRYPLDHQIPGGLPLLNFPEISMWGNFPWGGYGALPLPMRLQRLWSEVKDVASGGYPYSEGIFEDINKVVYSQFYWDEDIAAQYVLEDYVRFEFSDEYSSMILKAIGIMEKNSGMSSHAWATSLEADKAIRLPSKDHGASEALGLLMEVDKGLPSHVKKSWRWQLLLQRAILDNELRQSGGVISRRADRSFRRITRIQYLEKAHLYVQPPQNRGRDYPVDKIH